MTVRIGLTPELRDLLTSYLFSSIPSALPTVPVHTVATTSSVLAPASVANPAIVAALAAPRPPTAPSVSPMAVPHPSLVIVPPHILFSDTEVLPRYAE